MRIQCSPVCPEKTLRKYRKSHTLFFLNIFQHSLIFYYMCVCIYIYFLFVSHYSHIVRLNLAVKSKSIVTILAALLLETFI